MTLFIQYIIGLKARETKTCNFCGIKFYVTPTQPFWSLWGLYSHKFFIALNIKLNLLLINNEFMYNIRVIEKNSYIRQICGSYILVYKMVTVGRIVPPANSYPQ